MDKICTSLEQSYKLLKLKFDASTADMCWATELFGEFLSDWRILCISPKEYTADSEGRSAIPAWSLPALMGLVTSGFKSPKYIDTKLNFYRAELVDKNVYTISYTFKDPTKEIIYTWQVNNRDGIFTGMHEDPLDAMFELVCRMKKESLL